MVCNEAHMWQYRNVNLLKRATSAVRDSNSNIVITILRDYYLWLLSRALVNMTEHSPFLAKRSASQRSFSKERYRALLGRKGESKSTKGSFSVPTRFELHKHQYQPTFYTLDLNVQVFSWNDPARAEGHGRNIKQKDLNKIPSAFKPTSPTIPYLALSY